MKENCKYCGNYPCTNSYNGCGKEIKELNSMPPNKQEGKPWWRDEFYTMLFDDKNGALHLDIGKNRDCNCNIDEDKVEAFIVKVEKSATEEAVRKYVEVSKDEKYRIHYSSCDVLSKSGIQVCNCSAREDIASSLEALIK